MRLLHTQTFELREFLGDSIPEYVILSHTWEKEEVTFQDLMSTGSGAQEKQGWRKIQFCCRQAVQDGFSWAWIDTCCIDKTSSAELSESINSMYAWYKNSCICYAYLQDCHGWWEISESRWWTRGWTLQELIAPSCVEFFNAEWREMGSKQSMHEQVTRITGIHERILSGGDIFECNVAVRMSWAAKRETTRIEDQAYCLLGLFGVNMPLLYGEGDRAFKRLQEEILKVSEDYTLFTWFGDGLQTSRGLLAGRPRDFLPRSDLQMALSSYRRAIPESWNIADLARNCFSVFPPPQDHETPYMTSRGLHLTLPVWQSNKRRSRVVVCITLANSKDTVELACVNFIRLPLNIMQRVSNQDLTFLPKSDQVHFIYETFYVTEPRAESSIPTLFACDEMSAMLLIVKLDGVQSEQLSCYFSPWASMLDLLQHDEAYPSGRGWGPIPVEDAASLNLFNLTSLLTSIESRRTAGQQTLREELLHQCLGNAPEHCWFVELGNKFLVSDPHVKGVVCFGHKEYAYCAFQVQIGLYQRRTLCEVLPTTTGALRNEVNHWKWLQDAYNAALSTDRTTIPLASTEGNPFLPSFKFDVSIRRVATSSLGIRRYVLSITDSSLIRDRDDTADWHRFLEDSGGTEQ